MEAGKFNTIIGSLPSGTKLGDGNTIVNAADANGNVIINTPMAVGYGARAGKDSISIGTFADGGVEDHPPTKQKPSFWFHPITRTILYVVGVVIAAALVFFFGFK